MKPIHPVALFRLAVLGPLACRKAFERGEIKKLCHKLAKNSYQLPDCDQATYLSPKTVERWYYLWKKQGVDALAPKVRADRNHSRLPEVIQTALIKAKQENPRRSLDTLLQLMHDEGLIGTGELSRSSIHRLLQAKGLSGRIPHTVQIERRRFEAQHAGDLWYGDVMHGPTLILSGRARKVYLVSLMDDASRLITHSAFCLGETALEIEGVLKQALLKRGLPRKLVIDNGAAYRATSLQGIAARLSIRLIYCRPYDPAAKGKLERYHRFFRQHFLSELNPACIDTLADLNQRLWAWVDGFYHQRAHSALEGLTPLQRFVQDIDHTTALGTLAAKLDALFHHRLKRLVRKDSTLRYQGQWYEVDYTLAGQSVLVVVDPHQEKALSVESLQGDPLGPVTLLDVQANSRRRRHRPCAAPPVEPSPPVRHNLVEEICQRQSQSLTRSR